MYHIYLTDSAIAICIRNNHIHTVMHVLVHTANFALPIMSNFAKMHPPLTSIVIQMFESLDMSHSHTFDISHTSSWLSAHSLGYPTCKTTISIVFSGRRLNEFAFWFQDNERIVQCQKSIALSLWTGNVCYTFF